MRISPAGLLVVLAFVVPLLVQLRTVLGFFGIYVSVLQAVLIGVVVVAGIVLWAVFPEGKSGSPNGPKEG